MVVHKHMQMYTNLHIYTFAQLVLYVLCNWYCMCYATCTICAMQLVLYVLHNWYCMCYATGTVCATQLVLYVLCN